ncbi:hypothetical protein QE401_002147 [Pseudoroseomonas cervicalis]|nr:hypothetical protein [Pseudoroseomonas cervicalis]
MGGWRLACALQEWECFLLQTNTGQPATQP